MNLSEEDGRQLHLWQRLALSAGTSESYSQQQEALRLLSLKLQAWRAQSEASTGDSNLLGYDVRGCQRQHMQLMTQYHQAAVDAGMPYAADMDSMGCMQRRPAQPAISTWQSNISFDHLKATHPYLKHTDTPAPALNLPTVTSGGRTTPGSTNGESPPPVDGVVPQYPPHVNSWPAQPPRIHEQPPVVHADKPSFARASSFPPSKPTQPTMQPYHQPPQPQPQPQPPPPQNMQRAQPTKQWGQYANPPQYANQVQDTSHQPFHMPQPRQRGRNFERQQNTRGWDADPQEDYQGGGGGNGRYGNRQGRENTWRQRGGGRDREEVVNQAKKNNGAPPPPQKKSLGARRVNHKFVSPLVRQTDSEPETRGSGATTRRGGQGDTVGSRGGEGPEEGEVDERLKNIDPKMAELIKNEIMDHGAKVNWDDIAGLEHAKKTVQEIVVWPMLRPDLFVGLREPVKGLLLFGPPGTGKTLIGKCIASQSGATFFSISASSLTSKWVGEGEKMVRALFAVARCHQPAVVFIDEIDSLLSARSNEEHESSRRLKTEFLVQLDGAGTSNEDRILVIGATNRPEELDEAARRRLVKRLYIPLPEDSARRTIISTLLAKQVHGLTNAQIDTVVARTDGYSGADMNNLCKEAALGPIRSISNILNVSLDQVRPIGFEDFEMALTQVRASVSKTDLQHYEDWNSNFGSFALK